MSFPYRTQFFPGYFGGSLTHDMTTHNMTNLLDCVLMLLNSSDSRRSHVTLASRYSPCTSSNVLVIDLMSRLSAIT